MEPNNEQARKETPVPPPPSTSLAIEVQPPNIMAPPDSPSSFRAAKQQSPSRKLLVTSQVDNEETCNGKATPVPSPPSTYLATEVQPAKVEAPQSSPSSSCAAKQQFPSQKVAVTSQAANEETRNGEATPVPSPPSTSLATEVQPPKVESPQSPPSSSRASKQQSPSQEVSVTSQAANEETRNGKETPEPLPPSTSDTAEECEVARVASMFTLPNTFTELPEEVITDVLQGMPDLRHIRRSCRLLNEISDSILCRELRRAVGQLETASPPQLSRAALLRATLAATKLYVDYGFKCAFCTLIWKTLPSLKAIKNLDMKDIRQCLLNFHTKAIEKLGEVSNLRSAIMYSLTLVSVLREFKHKVKLLPEIKEGEKYRLDFELCGPWFRPLRNDEEYAPHKEQAVILAMLVQLVKICIDGHELCGMWHHAGSVFIMKNFAPDDVQEFKVFVEVEGASAKPFMAALHASFSGEIIDLEELWDIYTPDSKLSVTIGYSSNAEENDAWNILRSIKLV